MCEVIGTGVDCNFSDFLSTFLRLALALQNGNAYKARLPASLAERGRQVHIVAIALVDKPNRFSQSPYLRITSVS